MNTKSKIQIINEMIDLRKSYKDACEFLMNKYLIENDVFTFHEGRLKEVIEGYLEGCCQYKTIQEATSNWSPGMAICINNKENRYILGTIKRFIGECRLDNVYDIRENKFI